jgi:plasmid stabilization system protein ParE
MARKIVWTNNALEDLETVKTYLENKWPEKVLLSFFDKLVSKLKLIESFPQIGRVSTESPNRRRIIITKHNLLIYSLRNNEIVIEAIFDTRQDNEKLQL